MLTGGTYVMTGATTNDNGTDGGDANIMIATQVQTTVAGTVTEIHILMGNTTGGSGVQAALYTDSGGLPGSLLASSSSVNISGSTLTDYTFPIPSTAVTASTKYWIVFNPSSTNIGEGASTSAAGALNGVYQFSAPYGTWPSTYGTPSGGNASVGWTASMRVNTGSATDEFNKPLMTLSQTGQTTFHNSTDSSTAFLIQNAGGANLLTVNSSTGAITFGNSGNTLVFDPTIGLVASGTARHAKSIVLNAEYAGAVLDALDDGSCSAAYNGTMTSGYDATNHMNYYNWTSGQAANQCYDVVAQVTLPSDFDTWVSDPISIKMITDNTSNSAVSFKVIPAGGTPETSYNFGSFTVGTSWADAAGTANFTGTYAAGDTITIKIRMTSKNNANIKAGTITLNYSSKF